MTERVKAAVVSRRTLVPAGVAIAAVLATLGVSRSLGQDSTQVQLLQARVSALESRVSHGEDRLDKSDERWVKVREDLAAIKQALGVKGEGP